MNSLSEEFSTFCPEARLELINGQLVVGHSLAGSRTLLSLLLRGWGAQAGVAFAPTETWLQALTHHFPQAPHLTAPLSQWQTWAEQQSTTIAIEPRSRQSEALHHQVRQEFILELFSLTHMEGHFGYSIGRDFVMRLGDNGFTPDCLWFRGQTSAQLYQSRLEGPADLVVECLMPDTALQDRQVKRDYYAAAGVLDYWLIDPYQQTIEFLHWVDGQYQLQALDTDGCYRPTHIPGMAFNPQLLWIDAADRDWTAAGMFEIDPQRWQPTTRITARMDNLSWDVIPFQPRISLTPNAITFQEYMAWCTEAKFEYVDDRPDIGGRWGVQRLIGLLFMTFGLQEVVTLLHPKEWVSALVAQEQGLAQENDRRVLWWDLAHQAAHLLRQKFQAQRIGVIGDLVKTSPLNFWSELHLVVEDFPRDFLSEAAFSLYNLGQAAQVEVHLLEANYATPAQQRSIQQEMLDI